MSFEHRNYDQWAPFLLDILPSGFGRDLLVQDMGWLPDGLTNDVNVLLHGASNPAGNVRVAQAYEWLRSKLPQQADGWSTDVIQRRNADFIEYAHLHGTLVAGTSTQGQAAKLWMTQKDDGLYYADSLVADQEANAVYLVKLPRNDNDANLLRYEYHWLQLAKLAQLNVYGSPELSDGGLLFIPRFDKVISTAGVDRRRAMESVFSLMEVTVPGQILRHEDIILTWMQFADQTRFGGDLVEYLQRDILSYCLRVEDNHGRNTAFFLTEDGLELAPLFDFSPMFLAEDPPVRSTTWRSFSIGQHAEWPNLFDANGFFTNLLGPSAQLLAAELVAWRPILAMVKEKFCHLANSPTFTALIYRFDTALEALNALSQKNT
ncbi:HipA domain-containing protein [Leeia sp. TBRC 13508]|uniref:HipA domain-containing protein n=1 Tax=Leeia speluncae TaxID=2884804 RepID=A0ABS8DAB7_9NEIS|nr:HipA domain-containing protein [Leeia speluncae]MCB6185150.1 HipA domain-containing protein [Leeia speluncae]